MSHGGGGSWGRPGAGGLQSGNVGGVGNNSEQETAGGFKRLNFGQMEDTDLRTCWDVTHRRHIGTPRWLHFDHK